MVSTWTTVTSIIRLSKILLFLVCIPFATLVILCENRDVSLWTKQSGAMVYIFYMFNGFASNVQFYNSFLRWLIGFIVPFAFAAYLLFFAGPKDVIFNIGGWYWFPLFSAHFDKLRTGLILMKVLDLRWRNSKPCIRTGFSIEMKIHTSILECYTMVNRQLLILFNLFKPRQRLAVYMLMAS